METISGYCIDFIQNPVQHRIPQEIPFDEKNFQLVDDEVKTLLAKGAIIHTNHEKDEYISTIFIVEKKNGKFRPVINLRYLNDYVRYNHFKQETFKVVVDLLQKNDYMTSVDLQDAYFSVPIHVSCQKFLKFTWRSNMYKFVCLPFGLTSAPFVFTKLLKPVYAMFRQRNIRCSYYIDDSICMSQDEQDCQDKTSTIVDNLEALGFVVNLQKSALAPAQKITFFGFIIDSVEFKVFLTEEKVQKIVLKAKILLEKKVVVVRELASFIGLVINAFYAVFEAPLYYRALERNKLLGLGSEMNYENKVSLTEGSLGQLQWWIDNVQERNGKDIRPSTISIRCRTDASLDGWGAIDLYSDTPVQGRWNSQERLYSINYLELLAIQFALQSLYKETSNVHIEIQSDSITAIKYVNDMGGITSEHMDGVAFSLWSWCMHRNIHVSAIHIPGVLNTADFYSRNFSDSTEWMLKPSVFDRLCSHFLINPDIDLFASRLNHQLDRFVSWFPEPRSFHTNAFSVDWNIFCPYLFPPFNMVGKVLNKLATDKVDKAIIVCPFWRSQAWFPLLLDQLCSFPVRLPRHRNVLTLPHDNTPHPLGKKLKLIAMVISGRRWRVEEFRRELQMLSLSRGEPEHENNTVQLGEAGVFGMISDFRISFDRLRI